MRNGRFDKLRRDADFEICCSIRSSEFLQEPNYKFPYNCQPDDALLQRHGNTHYLAQGDFQRTMQNGQKTTQNAQRKAGKRQAKRPS